MELRGCFSRGISDGTPGYRRSRVLRLLFDCYFKSHVIETTTKKRCVVERFIGYSLCDRSGLSPVPAKDDNPRIVVLHG